jgi:hypothetical protein
MARELNKTALTIEVIEAVGRHGLWTLQDQGVSAVMDISPWVEALKATDPVTARDFLLEVEAMDDPHGVWCTVVGDLLARVDDAPGEWFNELIAPNDAGKSLRPYY